MTAYHDIFIHPGGPEETLLADLAEVCGTRLRRIGVEGVDYGADIGGTALELELDHDYEDDKGVPFERYRAVLTVRDFGGDKDRERLTAEDLFHRLAALQRYWLVLVFDLQKVIDRSAPLGHDLHP
ncbi:hypothetical protein [Streptomyces bauhiniae]|uniref:Uncharacterized protein n=1 Tax=Streptomyces bauhiniae TaxID=2340725 RepID=A0A7K3QVU7_9ACTN|nr:hypothetical protein [Streptomyces bauhiniae]NEB93961.1 hypothetical protein [Streptomyces bauhiniae]